MAVTSTIALSFAPAWALMWLLSGVTFGCFKWLTFAVYATSSGFNSRTRSIWYLLAWPGMDAPTFDLSTASTPPRGEWIFAFAKCGLGAALLWGATPIAFEWHPLFGGWVGMIGIAFVLHFGILHLLSLAWREAGVDARPIMNAPILAKSLSDFWSRRWNLAFRDAAHQLVFRPLVGRYGAQAAALAVFAVSGLVHDVVISVSVGVGYGLPTLYFCIQAIGFLFERRFTCTRRGWSGRRFAAVVVIAPLGLLFHTAFVEEAVLPTLRFLGCL